MPSAVWTGLRVAWRCARSMRGGVRAIGGRLAGVSARLPAGGDRPGPWSVAGCAAPNRQARCRTRQRPAWVCDLITTRCGTVSLRAGAAAAGDALGAFDQQVLVDRFGSTAAMLLHRHDGRGLEAHASPGQAADHPDGVLDAAGLDATGGIGQDQQARAGCQCTGNRQLTACPTSHSRGTGPPTAPPATTRAAPPTAPPTAACRPTRWSDPTCWLTRTVRRLKASRLCGTSPVSMSLRKGWREPARAMSVPAQVARRQPVPATRPAGNSLVSEPPRCHATRSVGRVLQGRPRTSRAQRPAQAFGFVPVAGKEGGCHSDWRHFI